MTTPSIQALPLAGERFTGDGTNEPIVVRSPYDGSTVGAVPTCTAADVDRAVAVAAAALRDVAAAALEARRRARPRRGRRSPSRRSASPASSPPRPPSRSAPPGSRRSGRSARSGSPPPRRARSTARWCRSTPSPPGEGKIGFAMRVPIGVVGAIAPFNFPLNLVAHKLAPAIAAGCPVVLKPASQTPLSAIALAELLIDECGLPPEWLHVVTGSGGTVGNAIVDHPGIALVTFTGSPEVGWGIRARGSAQAGGPRARQQRPGHHRRRQRLEDGGVEDPRRRVRPRRAELHLHPAGAGAPRRSPSR